MLLIQVKKLLPSNTYTLVGINRTFGDAADTCFEIFYAGPASRIPERYDNRRVSCIYPNKCSDQVIDWKVILNDYDGII